MARQVTRQQYRRTEDAIKVYSLNDVDTCWTWHLVSTTVHEPNGDHSGLYTKAFRKILGQADFEQFDLGYTNDRIVLTAMDHEQVGPKL